MSIDVEYKFKPPLTKVIRTLDETKKGLSKQVQNQALKKALKPVVSQAKSGAPVRQGHLKRSITARTPPARERRRHRIPKDVGAAVVDTWRKPYKQPPLKRYHIAVIFHTTGLKRTKFDPFIHRAIEQNERGLPPKYFDAMKQVIERKLAKL